MKLFAKEWVNHPEEIIPDLTANSLPPEFYARNTIEVARDLLGKILVVRPSGTRSKASPGAGTVAGRIVETEAYRAGDPASHSCRGETPRSAIMFGKPGVAYVYFIYGMYEMLNFVTEPQGSPGAVLIRAVEPLLGDSVMKRRRQGKAKSEWTSGPGRLCRAMGIQMSYNGENLRGPHLFVCDDGFQVSSISISERVGIRAGREKPWRFFITDHPFVSRVPQNSKAVREVTPEVAIHG